jgi:hypothetical protein
LLKTALKKYQKSHQNLSNAKIKPKDKTKQIPYLKVVKIAGKN